MIESNTDFIEDSGFTIRTKDTQSIPMFVTCAISYENPNNNADALTYSFRLNTADSQFQWGQFRGWNGGSYTVGDDTSIGTNLLSFTYERVIQAPTSDSFVIDPSFCSTVLFFPERID